MKNIIRIFLAVTVTCVFVSCDEQDIPTAEGSLLDFQVEDTPPTLDYVVGAHYARFDWSSSLYEAPAIGEYASLEGDVAAYDEHISMASDAGIDFFIFRVRSGVVSESFTEDTTFVSTLQGASNASSQNFTLSYNFGEMELSGANRIDVEAGLVDQMVGDFVAMGDYFTQGNYQKTSGGEAIVYFQGADQLFAESYSALFDTIRTAVSTAHSVDLFIIAEQQPWTPPMRFEPKFKDNVDAVSHFTYARITGSGTGTYDYDRFIQFEQYVDLAMRFSSEELTKIELEYIPQISPSYDPKILNASAGFFEIEREEEWFRTFCDIAKRASGNNSNNIIILDSFNNWNLNTQIEPAESYNTQYLEILRNEFKLN